MILALTVLTAAFWEWTRRERVELHTLQARYKLFALRDELREYAVSHPDAARSWLFAYLDSTLARGVNALPQFSLWHAIVLVIAYRRPSNRFLKHQQQLLHEICKENNKPYKQVYEKYIAILGHFILERHFLVFRTVLVTLAVSARIHHGYKKLRREASVCFIESVSESPLETHSAAALNTVHC